MKVITASGKAGEAQVKLVIAHNSAAPTSSFELHKDANKRSSLKMGSHDVEKLLSGLSIQRARMCFGIDQVGAYVILESLLPSVQRARHARRRAGA